VVAVLQVRSIGRSFFRRFLLTVQAEKKGSTTDCMAIHLVSIMSLQNDSSLFSEEKVMATLCWKEILEALPLHLWSRSGYLAGRTESSLSLVIRSTAGHLSPQKEREATYSLAVTIF